MQRRLSEVPGVAWAVVNTVLGHAVVATEDPSGAEEIASVLVEAVEAVEETHGVDHPLPDHPLSGDALRRAAWAVAVHMAAAPLAAATELTRRAPIPTWIASLFPMVDSQPRLRSLVERAVGTRNAKMLMVGLTALGQAGSGGLLGTGVDAVRHALRVMEADAEGAAWAAAEPRLTGSAGAASHGVAPPPPPRRTPLKRGPVERYADQAPSWPRPPSPERSSSPGGPGRRSAAPWRPSPRRRCWPAKVSPAPSAGAWPAAESSFRSPMPCADWTASAPCFSTRTFSPPGPICRPI
ncbi:hypothetical protein ACFQ0G_05240 [Streptomyces chiangmaiensis]